MLHLQLLLAMSGRDPGPLDGVWGPRTEHACLASTVGQWRKRGDSGPIELVVEAGDIEILRAAQRRPVEVRAVRTPIIEVNMRIALAAGYAVVFDRDPNPLAVRVALAQLVIEHGCTEWSATIAKENPAPCPPLWGERAFVDVWDFNVGNQQVPFSQRERPPVPHFYLTPDEVLPGGRRPVRSPHPAFSCAAEGAVAYWTRLDRDYPHVLPAYEAGDPEQAAVLLKGLGPVGGPFVVGELVTWANGHGGENLRGRVTEMIDGGRVVVQWPSRRASVEQSALRKAFHAYYTGSMSDYFKVMVDRFKAIAP